MSFDQLPIVDRYSENEDESNNHFRLHFCQRNGFLTSKPEDKGCDFIVELINKGQSTNWRFPIQLKSIDAPTFIEKGTTISYSFEVSRLRYMLEPVPPVGLIMLYWPKTHTLYYDYAEDIYRRLLEKREGNMAWQSKENVNIHIPTTNVVNSVSLSKIHSQMIMRHQNSGDRSPSLYPNATAISESATQPESQPAKGFEELLKNEGLKMFYNNEIPKLGQLLGKTHLEIVRENSQLSLLAGITYWQMGLPVDASFFLDKTVNNQSITAEDHEHAMWMKLLVDKYLGKIGLREYNEKVKYLLSQVSREDEVRRIRYELCIATNELQLLGLTDTIAIFALPNYFASLNDRIGAAKFPNDQMVGHYLQNVSNLGILLIKAVSFFQWKITQDKNNGQTIDTLLIAEMDSFRSRLTHDIELTYAKIKPLALNFVHDTKLAEYFETQVSFWLMIDINTLRFPIKTFDFHDADHKRRLILHTSLAKEALQIYFKHQFYRNAYNTSLMLLELNDFGSYSDLNLEIEVQAIREQAEWMRKKIGLLPFQLQVKTIIEAYKAGYGSEI